MIGSRDIVADRFRGMRPDEYGAGIANAPRQRVAIGYHDFKVLRRYRVDERQGFLNSANQNDRAEISPGGAGNPAALQLPELRFDSALDRRGELLVVGTQYRLCAF